MPFARAWVSPPPVFARCRRSWIVRSRLSVLAGRMSGSTAQVPNGSIANIWPRSRIRLLAVALPAAYLDGFLQHGAPAPGIGACGLYQLLSRRIKLADSATQLGYEILGVEEGGSCHSFLCNYLEVPYRQDLQIPFNDHGLISEYDDAVRAADYTNLPSTGSEPVPWYPWLIVEYTLPPNEERQAHV